MPRVRRPTSRLAQLLRLMRTSHPRRREAGRLRRGLRVEALEKRELLTTILVNVRDDVPDGDIADGTVSLRDAVERAPRGATIVFAPHLDGATIALESFGFNGPDPQLEIRQSLTIDASMLSQGITIRAYDPDRTVRGNGTRIFNVKDSDGQETAFTLKNVTLTGGDASGDGGAIRAVGKVRLTLDQVTLTGNSALYGNQSGGGLFFQTAPSETPDPGDDSPRLQVRNSVFQGNIAGDIYRGDGGGAYIDLGGDHGSTFPHTQARRQRAVIENSSFESNVAGNRGGGMHVRLGAGAEFELVASQVTGNEAGVEMTGGTSLSELRDAGGGLYAYLFSGDDHAPGGGSSAVADRMAKVVISGSTIDGNQAGSYGGGIAVCAKREDANPEVRSQFALVNSTVSGNAVLRVGASSADAGHGGGVALALPPYPDEAMDSHFSHVTVFNNTAQDGGGVWSAKPPRDGARNRTWLTNTIVSGNYQPAGATPNNLSGSFDVEDSVYNLLGQSNGPIFDFDSGQPAAFRADHNVFADDPQLGGLEFHGGPTRTHRPRWGSPAIDGGSDAHAEVPFDGAQLEVDQRGWSRLVDIPGVNDDRRPNVVDIGSHEYSFAKVANVAVSGSDSRHAAFSFAATVNGRNLAGDQLRTVPVGGADTIAIQFTENVLQVRPDSLQLVGLFFGSALPALLPGAEGFAYDDASRTATWSFAGPLPADQYYLSLQESVLDSDGNALDGEWINPFSVETTNALVSQFPSGNGEQGGDFNFVFTILPGDATRDNRVTWGDLQRYITSFGASQRAFEQSDYDGDGEVTEADLVIWEARFGTILRSLAFADFNQDYQVDVRDAGILVTNFGAGTGAQHALGDSDADGDVDGTDLLRLSRQWGLRLSWLT